MLEIKEQKKIEERNKKIGEAILISQMMDHKGFSILKKNIEEKRDFVMYQNILGIKDDALKDQKGIVCGIMQILNYFDEVKSLAMKERKDPLTGEKEVLNKKK